MRVLANFANLSFALAMAYVAGGTTAGPARRAGAAAIPSNRPPFRGHRMGVGAPRRPPPAAAVSAHAALSRGRSGLHLDALALAQRRARGAAVRFHRPHGADLARHGDCLGRWPLLLASRHRLARAAPPNRR